MKKMFRINFFTPKEKGVDKQVVAEQKATKSPESLTTSSIQTEEESIPTGCWPFKWFRLIKKRSSDPQNIKDLKMSQADLSQQRKRKHKVTPILVPDQDKISSNNPTSPHKPTDEDLLRLFSTSPDQNKKSPNTESRTGSDETKDEEMLQDVTLPESEKFLHMPAVGLSGTQDNTTGELETRRTSPPSLDETTKDTNYIHFLELLLKHSKDSDLLGSTLRNPFLFQKLKRNNQALHKQNLKQYTINPRGFPNIGNTCYMNSTLQSLLSMGDFFKSIKCTKQVWSLVPEAQLLSKMDEIGDCHTLTDSKVKIGHLKSLKKVVSDQAPEFSNGSQNDAHEFLMSVLSQIQCLAPLLKDLASCLGTSYTCPVEENLVFRMENTRTCMMCGYQSLRQEEFTNLSLDLVSGGSVDEMLEKYLMEVELEFKCECGGRTSGQKSTFATLPRFLILHLKRFRFTPSFNLEKVYDPVRLQRELVVPSKLGGGCYSLISAISHFGNTEEGHYICDGVHPDIRPDEPNDMWLTFDDANVDEAPGWIVCTEREESAYVLFYKRHL